MGIEKMRFLYLSISADHAASLPARHSRTKRSFVQARSFVACFFKGAFHCWIRLPCGETIVQFPSLLGSRMAGLKFPRSFPAPTRTLGVARKMNGTYGEMIS